MSAGPRRIGRWPSNRQYQYKYQPVCQVARQCGWQLAKEGDASAARRAASRRCLNKVIINNPPAARVPSVTNCGIIHRRIETVKRAIRELAMQ
jgi:hypothetical protein